MKPKQKLMICALIFFSGAFFNLVFSHALHNTLSKKSNVLRLAGFIECINSIISNRQHLLLFLCLQGFIAILAVVFYIINMQTYQSSLNTITPDIQTPAPVGQFQHGSAKWLTDKEKAKAFECFIIDPNNEGIAGLIASGYDGLEFMENETIS